MSDAVAAFGYLTPGADDWRANEAARDLLGGADMFGEWCGSRLFHCPVSRAALGAADGPVAWLRAAVPGSARAFGWCLPCGSERITRLRPDAAGKILIEDRTAEACLERAWMAQRRIALLAELSKGVLHDLSGTLGAVGLAADLARRSEDPTKPLTQLAAAVGRGRGGLDLFWALSQGTAIPSRDVVLMQGANLARHLVGPDSVIEIDAQAPWSALEVRDTDLAWRMLTCVADLARKGGAGARRIEITCQAGDAPRICARDDQMEQSMAVWPMAPVPDLADTRIGVALSDPLREGWARRVLDDAGCVAGASATGAGGLVLTDGPAPLGSRKVLLLPAEEGEGLERARHGIPVFWPAWPEDLIGAVALAARGPGA